MNALLITTECERAVAHDTGWVVIVLLLITRENRREEKIQSKV